MAVVGSLVARLSVNSAMFTKGMRLGGASVTTFAAQTRAGSVAVVGMNTTLTAGGVSATLYAAKSAVATAATTALTFAARLARTAAVMMSAKITMLGMASMYLAGKLTRATVAAYAFQRAMRLGRGALGLFGRLLQNTIGSIVGFATRMFTILAPFIGIFGLLKAFSMAESFQREMNASLAIVRDFDVKMRKPMENLTRTLAFNTKYSMQELAKGYYYLASAGLNVEQMMATLPITADFAQAGMMDLADATDILTDAVTGLGLDSKDTTTYMKNMGQVANVVAMAASEANASVQQFGEAITEKSGARMKMLKIPLEEGMALLQAYAAQNRKGTQGGTAFDILMRDLTKSALRNAKAFKDANLELYTFEGRLRTLPDIVESLENALEGLTPEKIVKRMQALGIPSKSSAFAAMVLGMSGQMREWTRLNKEAIEQGDLVKKMAEAQWTPFMRGWNKIKASFENWSIQVLGPFLDKVGFALELVGKVYESFAGSMDKATNGTSSFQKGIDSTVSKLTSMEYAFMAIADAIHYIGAAWLSASAAIRTAINPLMMLTQMIAPSKKGGIQFAKYAIATIAAQKRADAAWEAETPWERMKKIRWADKFIPGGWKATSLGGKQDMKEKPSGPQNPYQAALAVKTQGVLDSITLGITNWTKDLTPADFVTGVVGEAKPWHSVEDIESALAKVQREEELGKKIPELPTLALKGSVEAYQLMTKWQMAGEGTKTQEEFLKRLVENGEKQSEEQNELISEGNLHLEMIEERLQDIEVETGLY